MDIENASGAVIARGVFVWRVKMEVWKDIKGYEGIYQVSSFGRVKKLTQEDSDETRILSQTKQQNGYLYVSLYENGKVLKRTVHRLVADAFIPNKDDFPCVNHKDENKQNNMVENLEWCTHKHNSNYGSAIKRSSSKRSKKVRCLDTGIVFNSIKEASELCGIDPRRISDVIKGKRKNKAYLRWEYVDELDKEKNKQRKVRCIETGDVFKTPAEASRKMGIKSNVIYLALYGLSKTSLGYHWEYVDDGKLLEGSDNGSQV